jgi:matrixin
MFERRMLTLVAATIVFLASAVLWKVSVRTPARSGSAPPGVAKAESASATARRPVDTAPPSAPAAAPTPPAVLSPPPGGGTSYIVLLARSEIRRRIRASAGLTYLNEILAATSDSTLHRWDGRVSSPVRVSLVGAPVANFQPAFLDAVRAAFQRWEDAGVPVRFVFDADSSLAEVQFRWRIQFEGERSGQTDLQWDGEGHVTSGVITLATFDPKGQPLGVDDVRVMAIHEIGHLLGLDHSPDPGDIMYAQPKVRDLSARDIATVLLLYDLAPGSLRVGG